ncbi:MAG TPA: hypothetical protein VGP66_12350 [Candidatus Acidoferrum sp.]|nr:hypothetical protein [Candidatus Acidoferrum sp.]
MPWHNTEVAEAAGISEVADTLPAVVRTQARRMVPLPQAMERRREFAARV